MTFQEEALQARIVTYQISAYTLKTRMKCKDDLKSDKLHLKKAQVSWNLLEMRQIVH